ncbi:MAG: ribosome maturation factor RimM [Actinomycetota bacterium]
MLVTVGRVGRAHGIRGELAVEMRTDVPEKRFTEGAVLSTDPAAAGPLTVSRVRWHGDRLLVRFAGVPDRSAAERLRGVELLADVDEREATEDPDEFPDHRLVGLVVQTRDGTRVGEVGEVVHLPGHDLLAVRGPGGGETLVPFVAEIVPEIDLDRGLVTINPPPGLLDPEDMQEAGE